MSLSSQWLGCPSALLAACCIAIYVNLKLDLVLMLGYGRLDTEKSGSGLRWFNVQQQGKEGVSNPSSLDIPGVNNEKHKSWFLWARRTLHCKHVLIL
jgi:hypothetical protein